MPHDVPAGRRLRRLAVQTLDGNWARGHTVPSRQLYPHQWSWDAAFIAIGLAHYAPERAWHDLRALFAGQWADGRVPHIVFDASVAEADYFPGPAFWRAPSPPAMPGGATTGLVQPPVHAVAAWEVYARDRSAAALGHLGWLYPRLVAQQEYLLGRRNAGGAGLPAIVHPWESGLDNSPAWDAPLTEVPVDEDLLRRYARQDLRRAHAEHRPTDVDYCRYIHIAETYRDSGYADGAGDPAGLADRHPFVVECPNFVALTAAAERALAAIARVLDADPAPHLDRAAALTAALVDRLYDPVNATFHALDVRTGKLSPARCVNGLTPLILPDLPEPAVRAILAEGASPRFGWPTAGRGLPLPSHDRTAPDFDPVRYWRGPSWININWLLWRGLRTHGRHDLAAALRAAMLGLIDREGCFEYYHPDTGQGVGAAAFSWTAALALDLLAEPAPVGSGG
ncbi:MGH1-like glycoside hydrolase domain-containing protein [Rhizomonospora bruguierae]|uniref:MGH1-like glycoside hydrolase domain-containing protein n=1 Tax=Rhizomonospora bruguierae TaxID=1581705 RepID=UPI001BCADFAA|nr:hypothetical protein [Micromonospora sp. NBRC 107566]